MNYNQITVGIVTFRSENVIFNCLKSIKKIRNIIIFDNSNDEVLKKKIKSKYPKITFILNGGIDSMDKALKLSKVHDGVMIGRLIQNNPFCLKSVDKQFYNQKNNYIVSEKTIKDYFNFIRPNFGKDSIYRLLSPLLNIFFGVPNAKEFKINIHSMMKEDNFEILEKIFLNFIKEKKILIN